MSEAAKSGADAVSALEATAEQLRTLLSEMFWELRPELKGKRDLSSCESLVGALGLKSLDLVTLSLMLCDRFGFDFGTVLEDVDALDKLDSLVELVLRKRRSDQD